MNIWECSDGKAWSLKSSDAEKQYTILKSSISELWIITWYAAFNMSEEKWNVNHKNKIKTTKTEEKTNKKQHKSSGYICWFVLTSQWP